MITDSIKQIERYCGLHKNLDTAIAFLKKYDLTSFGEGKHEIDGEQVFVNVMEADLRAAEGALFEVHKKYADLQIDLTGSEYWECAFSDSEITDFDEATDFGSIAAQAACSGQLGSDVFVLFFPGEYHKPSCISKNCTHVRKAVIKIQMQD